MFYRVFFDPDLVRGTYASGPTGLALLLATFRSFFVNCTLCEVDGYLVGERLKAVLNEVGKDAESKQNGLSDFISRLKKLLVQMEKLNRFVDVLSTSEADQSFPLLALSSAQSAGIDFILTNETLPAQPALPERGALEDYHLSNFERERAKQVDDGLIPKGDDNAEDFFPNRFGKILPLAREVIIVDGILGRKFGDNFQFTLKQFIEYLEASNRFTSDFLLTIHTEDSDRISLLETRMSQWCKSIRFEIRLHPAVAHERYLFTDQFGLQLGIGMDLLDRNTGRNRETDFSYCRRSKLHELLPTK